MKSTLAAVGLLACITLTALWSEPGPGGLIDSPLDAWLEAPLAAGAAAPTVNPKITMQQAAAALRAQRLPEALAAFEKVASDPSRDAVKFKPDALYQILLLRLSPDPSVRDLTLGAGAIDELQRAYPAHERRQEIAIYSQMMKDADQELAAEKKLGETRLAEADRRLKAAQAKTDELSTQLGTAKQMDDSARLRQEIVGLRTETRNLRDQLAKTQAELQKKDEALKRVAGSLIKPR